MFTALMTLLTSISLHPQDVQQATCIRPRNNPAAEVGTIYLHGWFPFSGSGNYINLERANRRQLQDLADRTGQSIAVPLATESNRYKMRTWNPSQERGTAAGKLGAIEKRAVAACGKSLAVPRRLIGFSDGGYMAREIAVQCAAKGSVYSAVMMIGAAGRDGSSSNRTGCAKFFAVHGASDTCASSVNGRCTRSIPQTMASMARSLGTGAQVLPTFQGGHELPPNDRLITALGYNSGASPVAATPATRATRPTHAPTQPPPARPTAEPGLSAGFLSTGVR